jgi:hypothetical protein
VRAAVAVAVVGFVVVSIIISLPTSLASAVAPPRDVSVPKQRRRPPSP